MYSRLEKAIANGTVDEFRKKERDRRRRWRASNPEKAKTLSRESSRRHRAKYPDENKAVLAEWRAKNPGKNYENVAKWRAKYPDKAHAQEAIRRARERNAPSVESVNRLVVAERDGWICQLCGEPIDAALEYPDPGYLNVDHVVPLSKGGGHTYSNVQASHAVCNNRKNNRLLSGAA